MPDVSTQPLTLPSCSWLWISGDQLCPVPATLDPPTIVTVIRNCEPKALFLPNEIKLIPNQEWAIFIMQKKPLKKEAVKIWNKLKIQAINIGSTSLLSKDSMVQYFGSGNSVRTWFYRRPRRKWWVTYPQSSVPTLSWMSVSTCIHKWQWLSSCFCCELTASK